MENDYSDCSYLPNKGANSKSSLFGSSRLNLAIVCFIGSVVIYALRIDLSVSIVCMVNHTAIYEDKVRFSLSNTSAFKTQSQCQSNTNSSSELSTQLHKDGEFNWPKHTQGLVLGGFFWGYLGTQILGGWLSHRYGPKMVLGFTATVGSLLTLLTPVAARIHFGALIGLRVLLGLVQGVTYPSFHNLWAQWSPPFERSILIGISDSGAQVGNVLALPLSALLCHSGPLGGWPSIYYFFGGGSLLWVVVWAVYGGSSPRTHRWISPKERNYIFTSLSHQIAHQHKVTLHYTFLDAFLPLPCSRKAVPVPWGKMIRSVPLWAAFVGHFAADWGAYTMFTVLPSFMADVLRFDIKSLGFFASVPYIAYFLCINFAAFLSDYVRSRRFLSTKNARKIAMLIALVSQAVFLLGAGFCECGQEVIAMTLLTFGIGLSGFQFSGFCVNYIDIAPEFAGLALGIGNTISCVGGILAPYIMGILTPNKSREEWQLLFGLTSGIMVLGAVFFTIFADGEVQEWAVVREHKHDTLIGNEESLVTTHKTQHTQ